MTYTIPSQNIDLSSWITLYNLEQFQIAKAAPWLRQLVVGLSPRRPVFHPRPAHVRFVVDKVKLGLVLSPSMSGSPGQYHSTGAPYLSSSTLCSNQKEKEAKPGNLPKTKTLGNQGSIGLKSTFTFRF
jgi:hypothetical protein